jgi:hypothetical protein
MLPAFVEQQWLRNCTSVLRLYVRFLICWYLTVLDRNIRNYMQRKQPTYVLNCTTPLFNIQAPICFGSGLPSSGSFLDSSELHEMQIE